MREIVVGPGVNSIAMYSRGHVIAEVPCAPNIKNSYYRWVINRELLNFIDLIFIFSSDLYKN